MPLDLHINVHGRVYLESNDQVALSATVMSRLRRAADPLPLIVNSFVPQIPRVPNLTQENHDRSWNDLFLK